ncbi:hypothetical protein RIF29_24977 [Crotalaria pallida]|uniref:HMA domain-containing protein n=1 Tax=Crotalaria pallida TaxID=3830 RepID=A0AAN9EMY4_CROPI
MAADPADQEAPPHGGETLKYQKWVLRVLIHCDGCKKKVKKVLQGIDGVYTTEVDSQHHKVTVTGNVEAETLIKRLERAGKFAELLPEIKPPPEKKEKKKSGKSKGGSDNNNKEKDQDQKKHNNDQAEGDDGGGSNEGCIDVPEEESDKENHGDECEDVGFGGDGGGGESGKKKKKKKKKKNKSGGNGGDDSAPPPPPPPNNGGLEPLEQLPSSIATNSLAYSKDLIGPPVQHAYPYPQMYYSPPSLPPPQPAYGLSYNTAYPVSSASYYVATPIMPMHAYNAPYPRLPPPPPPPSDPIKRYDDDDDEYGGGCSIM